MKTLLPLAVVLLSTIAWAETPAEIQAFYQREAVAQSPAYQPSAERGREFYRKQFNVSSDMPSCSSCHTQSPLNAGQHVVTGKNIHPLAPSVNQKRLSRIKKVEKWFRRNCTEVVGRECTAAEKTDFIAFLIEEK